MFNSLYSMFTFEYALKRQITNQSQIMDQPLIGFSSGYVKIWQCSDWSSDFLCLDYNHQQMKFVLKRELRWLMFMLVPFICLLLIHVITPLLFITSSTPLLQETYNIEKKDLQFRTIYSFQQINQQSLASRLIQYYKIFENLHSLIEQQKLTFLGIDSGIINFNNAFNFSQKITNLHLNNSYTEPISMWFATNCLSFSDLNDLQKYTYGIYASVEPYIRSLIPTNSTSSLKGVKTFISTQNSNISFQYPSQYEEEFNQINKTAFPEFDQIFINNYHAKNESISAYLQLSDVEGPTFSLCTVLADGDSDPYGVSCLYFDLNKLASEMFDIINFAHSDYFKISYSLVIPMITSTSRTYVRAIKVNQTGGYTITTSEVSNNTIGQVPSIISNVDSKITVNGSSTTILGPLIIEENVFEQSSLLYLGSRNTYAATSLSNSTLFYNQINMTIGLIAGLIVVASIITIVIMKRIMNNLDEELIELSNYCTFIIEDDLKIQVPEYNGTKDIKQVYEVVKIINKLNKYSHPKYFQGHFINKILAYCQAETTLKSIHYDTGALLENIGNSYFYMEEVQKTIEYYKQSVRSILSKIRLQFGTIDEIFELKQQSRLSKMYRENEIILIRRLFNLIESYNCLLECHMAKNIKERENQIIKDIFDYIDLFKKAVYPDFHMYAEFILVLFYQIKLRLYKGSIDVAQRILTKAEVLSEAYINSYAEIGKKMREKGSKYKLLHMKNKITSHSRMHPQKIKTFRCYFKALVLLKSGQHLDTFQALRTLFEGTKVGIFSNRVTWMIFKKIHNILEAYSISEHRLYSLSIYNQICPLKYIQEKQFHSQSCPYRYPSQIPKQEQEYIYAIDCLANNWNKPYESYFQERGLHIYEKFIKDIDRVSIIKFNTTRGIKIQCNLTMKQSKEQILRKQIRQSFLETGSYRILKNELFEAFQKMIYRIMKLKSQKIMIVYFQSLQKYQNHLNYLKKKEKSRMKRLNSLNFDDRNRSVPLLTDFSEFGNWIISVVRQSEISKCKICLICDEDDKMGQFRDFFGLNRINSRLWSEHGGVNLYHNNVYVIQKDHKVDIERILSKRVYAIPDNHIFIL